jgi:hypothetical protein
MRIIRSLGLGFLRKNGARCSQLISGIMPTASTSQILGNSKKLLNHVLLILYETCTFKVVYCGKQTLVHDLVERGLWNENETRVNA